MNHHFGIVSASSTGYCVVHSIKRQSTIVKICICSFISAFASRLGNNLNQLTELFKTRSATLPPIQIIIAFVAIEHLSLLVSSVPIYLILHKRHIIWQFIDRVAYV